MSSLRSWSNVGSQLYSLISIEIGWDKVCDCLDGSLSTCILVFVIGHGIGGKHIPIMARLAKGQTLE